MTPGTYIAMVHAAKKSAAGVVPKAMSLALTTFNVGQATEEKKVAFGCPDCHSTTVWHDNAVNGVNGNHPARFDPDYCASCHDNEAPILPIATAAPDGYKVSHDATGAEVFTADHLPCRKRSGLVCRRQQVRLRYYADREARPRRSCGGHQARKTARR